MKKLILMIMYCMSMISLSENNYILNADRIKKVFSQWELLTNRQKNSLYIDLVDRENEIRVQISNYSADDSPKKAQERFKRSTIDSGFVLTKKSVQQSQKYFNSDSISYIKNNIYGPRRQEHIFLNKVKFSVEYTGSESDYENALKLIKEGIDPTVQIKSRSKKTFSKNYSIDNFIDKNKLQSNFKKIYKNVTFEDIKGNNFDLSCYKITVDAKDYPRAVWIQANNNFSKKVMDRKSEAFIKSYAQKDWDGKDHSYKYTGEEKKIMPKYFGVNAKVYENDYMKRVLKQDIIGIYRYAVTEKYTITTVTFLVKGQKKVEQEEYEQFLILVKSALK
ncbi:hypothetical protein [Fusobacterium sp. PH5-44]|uniref:hypothetical protein n=1 Tax=unclassified Fusobacterium TaxID=2648384 RepID=UPI003D23EC41